MFILEYEEEEDPDVENRDVFVGLELTLDEPFLPFQKMIDVDTDEKFLDLMVSF
jgi:hypothetical protein